MSDVGTKSFTSNVYTPYFIKDADKQKIRHSDLIRINQRPLK